MTGVGVSEGALLVSIGASACAAAVHFRASRSSDLATRWAGIWATWAVVFGAARLVQLNTGSPEIAIAAARVHGACMPVLIYSLTRLVRSVNGRRPTRYTHHGFALCCGLALLALATPWFTGSEVEAARSLEDRPYLHVPTGPAMPLIGVQLGIGLAWCARELLRAPDLLPSERGWFALTLAVYVPMGGAILASSLGWLDVVGVAEFAPLVTVLGLCQLLAIRRQRFAEVLRATVTARSAALRESEARYRSVIENAPIGLLSVDASGQLEQANAALLEMLGSTREQFAGSFNVASEQNAKRSGFSAMLETALTSGEVRSAEFEFDSWWGRRLATRTVVAPRRDATGKIVGALAIVEDVSRRRMIERQIQQAQKMEAVGQLAAGIAHEINNPMAYVRSNLSMLAEQVGELSKRVAAEPALAGASMRLGEMEELIQESLQGVLRTVAIVRDLRDFSRSGQLELEAVDLNALLENAVRLATTHRAGGEQIVERLGQIPVVKGAPSQLRQLFLNLLVNGLRSAGAHGVVTISSELRDAEVSVCVHDDGPALPPALLARLFDPYAPAQTRAADPGLGLYISQQIARSHGGEIRVASGREGGTRFEVRLPVCPPTPE